MLGQFQTITPGLKVTDILAGASEADGSNVMWMNQIALQVKKEKETKIDANLHIINSNYLLCYTLNLVQQLHTIFLS